MAAELERRATRSNEPDRADQLRDDAMDLRAKASALADLLQAAQVNVAIPDPRQFSLLSDGGSL